MKLVIYMICPSGTIKIAEAHMELSCKGRPFKRTPRESGTIQDP